MANGEHRNIIIVGIGASAGGLEALQALVRNLPTSTNLSYIVAQHLSPTYKSMMVDLLSRDSNVDVMEAKDGVEVRTDTIYICPPNKNITLNNNTIKLTEPDGAFYGPKSLIDLFFESLANNKGPNAIGIILSGTGTDGSRGIRAIRAEGGITIAEEPRTAKYDGMPITAINTGDVDLILPPEQIGPELSDIINYPAGKMLNEEDLFKRELYGDIINKLKLETRVDFSLYKDTTIFRRIERRMTP